VAARDPGEGLIRKTRAAATHAAPA